MKTIFSFLLLLSLSIPALAQDGIHIGLFAGPQIPRVFNDEPFLDSESNYQAVRTWTYNVMGRIGYNFGPPLGLHLGVIYSRQGQDFNVQDSISASQVDYSMETTYLKFPLLLHINSEPAPAMFFFEFGPQLGLLQEAAYSRNGDPIDFGVPTESILKPNDIAFAWAIGAEFELAPWYHLVINHRGDYGLIDFEDKNAVDASGANSIYANGRDVARNATFAFQAGMVFILNPGSGPGRKTGQFWFR